DQLDSHLFSERGGDVLADIVSADRQLAVASVDHDRQLYHRRATEVTQGVQGSPRRPSPEQHVVDENHPAAVDTTGRQLRRAERPGRLRTQVVAVEGDVEYADRYVDLLESPNPVGDATG